jgi:hypothetical protein
VSRVRYWGSVPSPSVRDAQGDEMWTIAPYRALARAVILQAVKDVAARVTGPDGVVQYRDRGQHTYDAQAARRFLSTSSSDLAFWCTWLGVHPQIVMDGASRIRRRSQGTNAIH